MPRRGLNDWLLLWSVASLALLGVAVHLLHGVQVQRHARTLLAQAEEAESYGELGRSAARLSRYLQFAPDDTDALARHAALLDHVATTPAARWRVLDVLRQAVARDPSRHDLLRRFVARAMDASAFSEAAKHLEVLLRAHSEDVESATLLGRCLEAQGEFDRAVSAYEQAIDRAPLSVEACLRLASVFLKLGQPLEADEVVDRLVKALHGDLESVSRSWKAALDGPPSGIATTLVCAAFWARYGGPRAAAALTHLETLEKDQAPADRLRLLGALAQAHYHLGHFADAERLARRGAERAPSELASQVAWMDAALEAGRVDAVESLLPAIRRLEGESGTWWRFGEAALACLRGDRESCERARLLIVELASLRPGWSRLALLEARLDEQDGDVPRALDNWVRYIERGDVRPALVYQVSQRLAEWGRYQDADAVIVRLQRQAELGREFARFAAVVALRAGIPERAATLARQVVSEEARDYRDHVWRGGILAATGREPEAERAFRRAVQLAPHSPDAWIALVGFLADTGRSDRAETTLAEAECSVPREWQLLLRAAGEESLHHWGHAEDSYRQALAAQPDDPFLLLRAARFFLRLDRPRQAAPLLRRLLDVPLSLSQDEITWARRKLALALVDLEGPAAMKEAMALLDLDRMEGALDSLAARRARTFVEAAEPAKRGQAVHLLAHSLAPRSMTPEEQFHLARLLIVENDWPAASELMRSLLAIDKENPAYLSQYIYWLLDRGEAEDAKLWMGRLEKAAPYDTRTERLRRRFGKVIVVAP